MTSTLRDTLIGLPIYKPLRFFYQTLCDRDAVTRRKRRVQFYSGFIQPGDLVFDVGANLGNYAEALCDVGATVVAIEPDPRNVKLLRRRLRNQHVLVEQCAAGNSDATAELRVAVDRDDISTLSDEWAQNTDARWQGTVKVRVRTLDSIARSHGIPKYVKVDAEGYDAEVLRGMSFRPEIVSFEFLSRDLKIARQCVELLHEWSFNYAIEERSRFELTEWVSSSDILRVISARSADVVYGDVFARAPHQVFQN